jgi:hypothetical protein
MVCLKFFTQAPHKAAGGWRTWEATYNMRPGRGFGPHIKSEGSCTAVSRIGDLAEAREWVGR